MLESKFLVDYNNKTETPSTYGGTQKLKEEKKKVKVSAFVIKAGHYTGQKTKRQVSGVT